MKDTETYVGSSLASYFVFVDFASFSLISFRFYFVSHFIGTRVELLFSSFGDHLINFLRKVNRLIYAFKIN